MYLSTAYSEWNVYCRSGGGPLHPKYFVCEGDEDSLSDCDFENYTSREARLLTHRIGIHCIGTILLTQTNKFLCNYLSVYASRSTKTASACCNYGTLNSSNAIYDRSSHSCKMML